MRETRERRSFPTKPLCANRIDQRRIEELDGNLALVAPVAATREPHRAHSALPERTFERVRADRTSSERRRVRLGPGAGTHSDRPREKSVVVEIALDGQQRLQFARELRRVALHLRDEATALLGRKLQRAIEQRLER